MDKVEKNYFIYILRCQVRLCTEIAFYSYADLYKMLCIHLKLRMLCKLTVSVLSVYLMNCKLIAILIAKPVL